MKNPYVLFTLLDKSWGVRTMLFDERPTANELGRWAREEFSAMAAEADTGISSAAFESKVRHTLLVQDLAVQGLPAGNEIWYGQLGQAWIRPLYTSDIP